MPTLRELEIQAHRAKKARALELVEAAEAALDEAADLLAGADMPQAEDADSLANCVRSFRRALARLNGRAA